MTDEHPTTSAEQPAKSDTTTVQILDQGLMSNLADRINHAYAALINSAHEAIRSALDCGKHLAHAKDRVGHGEWLKWVEANTKVSTRQAQKLMQLASHAEEVLANANSGAHLTINAALKTVSERKKSLVIQAARGLRKGGLQGESGASPGAIAALQSDLAEIHSRGETRRILEAIAMFVEIGVTPKIAARVVIRFQPTLRVDAANAAEAAVAWLHDFIRELGTPPPSRQPGFPRIVHDAAREVPDS